MSKLKKSAPDLWVSVLTYFSVFMGVTLVAGFAFSLIHPTLELKIVTTTYSGIRAHLLMGGFSSLLICPVIAGFRCWSILHYYLAAVLATTLIFGNLGFALVVSLVSLTLIYATQKMWLVASYFGESRNH